MSFIPNTSISSGESLVRTITQTAHGFTVGQWVYINGTVYTLTDADALTSLDSVGVVTEVVDVNNFKISTDGYATGLSGLTAGTRYYLDGTIAGGLTSTAPTNAKAVLIADSTTSGWVQQYKEGSGVAAEYGANTTITDSQTTTSTSFVDVTGGSFVLPTAGTWEVDYNIFFANSNTGVFNNFRIVDSSNVQIANSNAMAVNIGNNSFFVSEAVQKVTITTTGSQTFRLQWGVTSGTGTIYNRQYTSGSLGTNAYTNSKISWKKISGFTPTSGTTVDFIQVGSATTNQSTTAGAAVIFPTVLAGNIPYNTSNGQFTLTAGKTYRMESSGTGSTTGGLYWYNVTGAANITEDNAGAAASAQSNIVGVSYFTPSVNTIVELRATATGSGSSANGISTGSFTATIQQIGSSAVGTTTINDQTPTKYFDIGGMRVQWGRTASVGDNNQTITFPIAFSSTPSVTCTTEITTGTVAAYGTGIGNISTTNFIANRDDNIADTDGPFFSWIAIGAK